VDRITAINQFSGTTTPYRGMWKSIEAKVCALREGQSYQLLSTRMFLTAEETENRRLLVEREGLEVVMWTERIAISHLDELLLQLRDANTLDLGEVSLRLGFYEKSTEWFVQKYSGRYTGYVRLESPYLTLETNGSSLESVNWNQIEVRMNRFGYDGLIKTANQQLGFSIGGGYTPQIMLVAPIYLRFKTVTAQNDSLTVLVEFHQAERLTDVSLSYEIRYELDGKMQVLNDKVGFTDADIIERQDNFFLLKKEIKTGGRISEARAWLYEKWTTEPIDAEWLHQEPETRNQQGLGWRALSPLLQERHMTTFVDGHQNLRRYLCLDYPDPSLANQLELAVSYLLGSMGFLVFFFGKPIGRPGYDLVAIQPDSDKALVISVHAANDISKKLITLMPEVNRLRASLASVELVPLIFAPVNPESILWSAKVDAAHAGVALVLRADLGRLFDFASTYSPTEARTKALGLFQELLVEQLRVVNEENNPFA
jgi:hypothetical protein